MKRGGDLLLPDTDGSWSTFALAPVSLKTWVYIAFDGAVSSNEIEKAMRILELALDWAPPGGGIESVPPEATPGLSSQEEGAPYGGDSAQGPIQAHCITAAEEDAGRVDEQAK